MTDKEKFEGLKKRLIEENEEKYGEIREKYGEECVVARAIKIFESFRNSMKNAGSC